MPARGVTPILSLLLLLAISAPLFGQQRNRINGHPVVLDSQGKLLSWMTPQSHFVLAHWGRRHLFDWRPVGPRRRTRQELLRFFSPELREEAYEQESMTGVPLPIGPQALGQCFWFERHG